LAVLARVKNPTGQTVSLKKVFLQKLISLFSHLSALSNAIVVCCPLSFFLLIYCRPILRAVTFRCLCLLPLSPSAVIVVIVRRH
jgi:hypothetical protein